MRRVTRLAVVATTVLAAVAVADEKKRVPHGLAGVGLTQAQVDEAIQKGEAFLLTTVPCDEESFAQNRESLLAAYTFAHTGAFARDKKLAATALAGLYKRQLGGTYETALVAMVLRHMGGRIHHVRIADAAKAIASQQGEAGGWTYGTALEGGPERTVPGAVEDPVIEIHGGAPIDTGKKKTTIDVKAAGPGEMDASCSQFALLGLNAAAGAGVDAPKEVWERAAKWFASIQTADGSWPYVAGGEQSYGSMTCAGITALAIAQNALGKKPADDENVKRGLRWIEKHFTFEENPRLGKGHHFYWIYGLERTGALLGTEFLGDHEWFPEGAKWLLGKQAKDGGWGTDENGGDDDRVISTCFALLFLTRATAPLPQKLGGTGTLRTALATPLEVKPDGRGLLLVLDASGSMNFKVGGRAKFDVVREAAKKLVSKLPDGSLVGLRVYGHNKPSGEKVGDKESELLIPVAKLDRALFEKTLSGLVAVGRTPIAFSLEKCVGDLEKAPAPCRVLLLSDGEETGGGDPVASAKVLAASKKCLAIDCLGFDIVSEPAARKQLLEISKIGKGRYTESEDAEVLARAGARASAEYVLLDETGKEYARGTLGDARPLPEGEYRFRVVVDEKPREATLWINTGVETRATVFPERAKTAKDESPKDE